MKTVQQHWDPLKVCAVGRSYPPEFYSRIENVKVRNAMEKIAIETEEDYQKLISKLEEFGVTVLRTDISDNIEDHWRFGDKPRNPPMCPRDHTAAVGSQYFMPSDKFGQNIDVEKIFSAMMDLPWHKVNTPRYRAIAQMVEEALDPNRLSTGGSLMRVRANKDMKRVRYVLSAVDTKKIKDKILQAEMLTIGSNNKFPMNNDFYCFQSIQKWCEDNNIDVVYDEYINCGIMTRVGKDLYFGFGNICNKINEVSFRAKMDRLFPDHRKHFLHVGGHTDGCFSAVKPGLIITLRDIQNYEKTFPNWDVVTLPGESWDKVDGFMKMKKKNRGRWWVAGEEDNDDLIDYIDSWMDHWVTYVEESVFDTNMLVLDENNVIVNGYNEKVFDAFERHNITPHIINFRHRYFWDGGLHCITSDIVREGEQKDYFPERQGEMVVDRGADDPDYTLYR